METGTLQRAGFVATNSIRAGSNREVLKRICDTGRIFNTWGDEPWVNDGAAVRVSLICFDGNDKITGATLDGQPVSGIYADLTAPKAGVTGINMTTSRMLTQNKNTAYEGTKKYGPFDIPGELARQWLALPNNPNGRHNREVIRPWANGMDITRRYSDTWIIDFGPEMSEADAALYEKPFEFVLLNVKPQRKDKKWWLHERPRPEMRKALSSLTRYIATPRVAKHRLFVSLDVAILPDSRLYVIASDSNTIFGILHSRFHEIWSLRTCSWHGVGNDPTYNASSCFETFPFPEGLTPKIPSADYAGNPHAVAIAEAARRLVELRDNWLNPPEWIRRESEVVSGYPDRILPVNEAATAELKKRTLTNLYNQRPAWLANVHRTLDDAVAAAYGWDINISDDEVLEELLKLNQKRSL